MKPKPPKPIWVCVYWDGRLAAARPTKRYAMMARFEDERVIRYIPAPTKRRKPRKSGGPR